MKPLTITASHVPAGLVLEVAGDLDYTNAQRLRHAAQETALPPGRRLVVDLSELEFCDSSGITALIAVRNHALATGSEMVLVAVPAGTRRLLHMTGLDQVFDMRDDPRSLTGR
ncbi:STAS domain-containing protein [Streptomyces griseomycini]|uniref:Anti-sigma factor antagonist n=1 Tax=Streptomyces griseomycini TaxID=66895 RepID=A0A7W7V8Q8_9ACTN|nr:STAS domain-containing protein [Streptomyces griseomycini]MBB4901290.1 anti-anti-sigma factor [Streptomyces griseomycini]GGQ13680.1 anti-sigma factor antagonist [Streptomyces griseomycini]GGR23650.1 anti-sigma factor antagonist [Streptomyces griseomycini]